MNDDPKCYGEGQRTKKKSGGIRKILRPLKLVKGHKKGQNGRLNRVYSLVPDSEVTPGSLEVWSDLPEEIKNDPSLAPFRNQYERQHGISANSTVSDLTLGLREDSLPPLSHHSSRLQNLDEEDPGAGSLPNGGERPVFTAGGEGIKETSSRSTNKVSFLAANLAEEGRKSALNNHAEQKPHGPPSHTPDSSVHDDTDAVTGHKKMKPWIKTTKIIILIFCWIVFTTILMLKNEKIATVRQISVPVNRTKSFLILEQPTQSKIQVTLTGPFLPDQYGNLTLHWLQVWVQLVTVPWPVHSSNLSLLDKSDVLLEKNLSEVWRIPLVTEDMVDFVPDLSRTSAIELSGLEPPPDAQHHQLLRLRLATTMQAITPVAVSYDLKPIDMRDGIIYAAAVLCGLYVLIVFEIVHRTFAALLASTMSIAILAALDERPSTAELISWIDVETLLLLFSMMVLVAILSETGIFDYLAVYAYKVTAGRVWPLINYLCLFTAVMSSFLDNVTTVLLMTPVTIRLCEVMELNPVPILMSMIIYSNVGGTLTPVGDPPNVIIASNAQIIKAGINFTTFTLHMAIGIFLVAIQTYVQLRFYYRDIRSLRHSEPKHVQDLRHEISIWQRAAASLSSYSKDEDLVRETLLKKVSRLLAQLKRKLKSGGGPQDNYKATLQELTIKYPIRNKVLLIKSAVAVSFVITVFFLHSIPELQRLSLGWTALLGALLLLILADRDDMEAVLARVEWSTLLFFAALFILMEALSKLGLIDWIGKQTESVILSVSEESRLAVAILLILWVSAIASAFVDNIPLTTMMVRIATSLGNNPTLNLPLQPLIWALAFGACLGGNGTLIGASANVVCAGVAEQHGYRISFMQYFKLGFPIMLGSVTVISAYLLVCHAVLQWH